MRGPEVAAAMLALQTSQKLLELFYFDINVFTSILKIFEQFGFRKDCYKLSDKIVKSDEQAEGTSWHLLKILYNNHVHQYKN